jgi:hypothetical protein
MRNFITIGSVVYERIEDKQTNKHTCLFYIYRTSCTLRALLRLQFHLNETRLIVYIEELLNVQYFLFFLLADHLVTGHLVTKSLREFSILNCRFDDIVHHLFHWSLGHLVTWSLSHLVTWSLATWSLSDKPFWACTLQLCKISLQSPQGTSDHLVTGHLVT